ncbi:MAG: pyridoxal phosphate-dependent aminotransferase [Lentisphaerae bacterium]|nr:pyridoxal phosphate-dependent aminotransferase [Lentisphaerota bacterium]
MFANRTNWTWDPSPLAAAAARRRREGLPILDLTETNPTCCGFHYLEAGAEQALAHPGARRYAPDARGLAGARDAIAGAYRARGVTVDPARLVVTAGTSEGYSHLMRLLLNPGDALLVPSPSYPLLDVLARLHDVRLIPYPLHIDDRWWLDLDGLRAACDNGCRAIVIISPNNPTGSLLTQREREALVALASARGLALIADEVFADYRLLDVPDAAPSLAGEDRVLTFTLNGISKMLGLPQMKVAWLVVNGPPAVVVDACRRLELMADSYLSVSTPAQLALPAWLSQGAMAQAEILERVRTNLAQTRALRQAACLRVEGGWTAVLRIPRVASAADVALSLLEGEGVLVDPGSFYGFGAEGYLVISLLPPPAVFAEGLRLLDARVGGG